MEHSKELLKRIVKAIHNDVDVFSIISEPIDYLPIELFKLKKLKRLHISHTNIAYLQPEIYLFENLEILNISNNQLTTLPSEISQLNKLKQLDFSSNKISMLPKEIGDIETLIEVDAFDNRLERIPNEFGKLKNLKILRLSANNFSIFPRAILDLKNLEILVISHNKIKSIPFGFNRLDSLLELYLDSNYLDQIPIEICSMKRLKDLQISFNGIKTIPKYIESLHNLKSLCLGNKDLIFIQDKDGEFTIREFSSDSHFDEIIKKNLSKRRYKPNSVDKLPRELRNLKNLEFLELSGNHLPLPFEIIDESNSSIILNYYFSLEEYQSKPINEVKLLVLGQGSVGKTSLVKRCILNQFDYREIKTDGITINEWRVGNFIEFEENKQIFINIWDFGGQEIMHATHQFFLTKRSLYLLVLDSRLTQEENRVEYWLKIIESFGGSSPVLIVGNKIDQHPLDIDRTGLKNKYPNIIGILETSAATGAGIEELKTAISEQVNNLPHVRDLLPETWFTVKTKLEALGREKNYISQENYLEMCSENEVSDEISQRTLIGFLHDLGVVLHFQDDPRLESLGILNPQWVTNGVYKILNSHALFQNKGVLTVAMLNDILNLPEYPRDKRLFIVDMMKKFELCYDLEHDKSFLVPDLLPKDEPQLEFKGIPAFEYAYPVLPSSVMTRFIVRMNEKIVNGIVWRTGVLLQHGQNQVLVKADIEDKKITIAIHGLEHTRRDALAVIRYQLDEIHASIKGLNPEKFVPVPGAVHAKPLKYEYLLKLERDGEEIWKVEDGDVLRKVNIIQMLNGVSSEYERKQSGSVTHIHIGGSANGSNIITGDTNTAHLSDQTQSE